MRRNLLVTAATLAALLQPEVVNAAEIKIWTARAIATVLAEIGSEFERETGHTLIVSSDLPPAFERRVTAGESFDLLISGSSPVDEWIERGRIVAATRSDIARSGIGVEVRAGAPRPDISSVDAFKRALLNARSIAYLRVGSGIYLAGLLERLGIAEAIKSKVTRPESDIVSELVAKGEIEIGMTVITQILTTPGVDLVGPLPPEIQSYITFTAGVSSRTTVPDAARQLIQFLRGPKAIAVIKAQGMEPTRQQVQAGNDSGNVSTTVACFPTRRSLPIDVLQHPDIALDGGERQQGATRRNTKLEIGESGWDHKIWRIKRRQHKRSADSGTPIGIEPDAPKIPERRAVIRKEVQHASARCPTGLVGSLVIRSHPNPLG